MHLNIFTRMEKINDNSLPNYTRTITKLYSEGAEYKNSHRKPRWKSYFQILHLKYLVNKVRANVYKH